MVLTGRLRNVTESAVTPLEQFESEGEEESGEFPLASTTSTGLHSADFHDTGQPNSGTMTSCEIGLLARNSCLVFLVCVFIGFMQVGLFAGHQSHALDSGILPEPENKWLYFLGGISSHPQQTVLTEHPIPKLMADAETRFRKLLSRQSRTLKAAVNEYKKRYDRDPPKGFDEWWKFTKDNNVKMIDEYDGLVEDLAPFWEMSGEELRLRAMQAGNLPSIDLVRVKGGNATSVNIKNGFATSDVSARANGFRQMINKFVHTLPDMDFPINARSEGRILVPWEHREYPNLTIRDSSDSFEYVPGQFDLDWQGNGNVWEAFRRTCPPSSPARRLFSSVHNTFPHQVNNFFDHGTSPKPGVDFHFAKTTDGRYDFCQKPWAHYNHGHFFSDWRTIPALYPVFSPAKAPGFLDVRIPSHYYYGSTPRYTYAWDAVNLELRDIDPMEVPWDNKTDKFFWRGATTGGGSQPPGFSHQYQRHRFLRMAGDTSLSKRTITFADPPTSPRFVSALVSAMDLNEEIMDTAFVKPTDPQNYPGGLEAMERELRYGDAFPLGKHWSYKYLIDLDGMSYSGKFMAFLASDSVAVKSTVYQEYFSDWIQPWLHFIPLSSSYKEIYNIHAFFSGATQSSLIAANSTLLHNPHSPPRPLPGDRRLRRIARAGKQWKRTIGRTVDMEAYVYRLCLEYARLWQDDRDSMGYQF